MRKLINLESQYPFKDVWGPSGDEKKTAPRPSCLTIGGLPISKPSV